MTLGSVLASRRGAQLGAVLLLSNSAVYAQSPMLETTTAHFSVFHSPGSEKDARAVQAWAEHTEQVMHEKYGVSPRHYRMSIYVYAEPRAKNRCE